jgi:hypothetical protein
MKDGVELPNKLNRRSFALGGVAALAAGTLGVAGVAAKQATPSAGVDDDQAKPDLKDFTYLWSATSPATHKGDTYTIDIKNTGATSQKLYVRTVIMDHHTMTNSPVVTEEVTLDPGAEKTLTATNTYGTANHFVTRLLTETNTGLAVKVTLTDSAGQTTATFTQGAFWVQSRDELRAQLKGNQKQRRKLRRRLRRHGRM